MNTTYSAKQGHLQWLRFLDKIDKTLEKRGCLTFDDEVAPGDPEAWFRGHSNSTYKLLPSLHRKLGPKGIKKIASIELDLFREFSCRAKEVHGVLEDDWDILFAMQHYGLPTRLLDWTESLAVAVYFAVLGVNEPEDDEQFQDGMRKDVRGKFTVPPPSIWVLNPYILNDCKRWVPDGQKDGPILRPKDLGYDAVNHRFDSYSDLLLRGPLSWEKPAAICPVQRNPRLHSQRAWFTIHGSDPRPLGLSEGSGEYVKEVILPFAAVGEAKRFLRRAGIDHYLLFPDLPTLSLQINQKRGLMKVLDAELKMLARM